MDSQNEDDVVVHMSDFGKYDGDKMNSHWSEIGNDFPNQQKMNGEFAWLQTDLEQSPHIIGRVEVCQKGPSNAESAEIEIHVRNFLSEFQLKNNNDLTIRTFSDPFLSEHIDFVSVCDLSPNISLLDKKSFASLLEIHVYQLHESGYATEELDDEEALAAANHWILPSADFQGLWESLYYEENIKQNLLHYARTTLLFSDQKVDSNIITWNRLILLHGPPGTGKTSLCKALAQKLSIVMSKRYRFGQLIEINSHSLFSKWFSESGKLVMKMFQKIQEIVSDPEALVCVLIDEVESLSASRQSMSGSEPSDAIRVVNALLTQLDLIKRHPNVIILTTSNITGAIDSAFLDRADIRQYIGLPTPVGIYEIYYSCIMELIRTGIVINSEQLVDRRTLHLLSAGHLDTIPKLSRELQAVSEASVGLSGRMLRKLPFIAHALFVQSPPSMNYTLPACNAPEIHFRTYQMAVETGFSKSPKTTLERFLVALLSSVNRHFKDCKNGQNISESSK